MRDRLLPACHSLTISLVFDFFLRFLDYKNPLKCCCCFCLFLRRKLRQITTVDHLSWPSKLEVGVERKKWVFTSQRAVRQRRQLLRCKFLELICSKSIKRYHCTSLPICGIKLIGFVYCIEVVHLHSRSWTNIFPEVWMFETPFSGLFFLWARAWFSYHSDVIALHFSESEIVSQ